MNTISFTSKTNITKNQTSPFQKEEAKFETPSSPSFKEGGNPPVFYNENTWAKDLQVVKTYMMRFLKFCLTGGATELPQFTSPATPSFVKRVVLERDIPASTSGPFGVKISPFCPYAPVVFSGETPTVNGIPPEAVKCYTHYRVVACRALIKQVGVTAINDSLGTVIDGVVAPPNLSVAYMLENLSNIQLPANKIATLVSGREGLEAFVLGSPEFPPHYPGDFQMVPEKIVTAPKPQSQLVSAGTIMMGLTASIPASYTPEYSPTDSDPWTTPGAGRIMRPEQAVYLRGTWLVQEPHGESIFFRTSPAPEGVHFRLQVEYIVQGPLTPEYALTMPQSVPRNCFDFGRAKYAWENLVPAVAPCATMTSSVRELSPVVGKPGVGYASLNQVQPQPQYQVAMAPRRQYTLKAAPVKETPLQLPNWVKRAIKFSGDVIAKLKTSGNTNRFARSASTPPVNSSYSFFPMVTQKEGEVVVGVVCVTQGVHAPQKYETTALTLDEKKPEVKLEIYFDKDDFEKPEDFLGNLDTVCAYVYGPCRQPVAGPVTVRFFSDLKVAGNSYMYALTISMIGGPSGGFYTGAFEIEEATGNPIPGNMDEKVIETKLKAASLGAPLHILSSKVPAIAGAIMVGGVVNSAYNGKAITCFTCDAAFSVGLLPFRIRSVKATPIESFAADAVKYHMGEAAQPFRQYIALKSMNPNRAYDVVTGNAVMGAREFARADPSNYTTTIEHKGAAFVAKDFYAKYSNLLADPSLFAFEYNDNLYVNPFVFKGHAKSVNWPYMAEYTNDVMQANNRALAALSKINAQQVKELKEEIKSKGNPRPIGGRQTVRDLLAKPSNTLPVKKAWEELQKITDGFLQLYASLSANTKKFMGNETPILTGQGGDFLKAIKLPTKIGKEGVAFVARDPVVGYLEKMVKDIGPAAAICVAYAAGVDTVNKPNPKLTTLQAAIDFVKKNQFPKIKLDQEANDELQKSFLQKRLRDNVENMNEIPNLNINNDIKEEPPESGQYFEDNLGFDYNQD